jgi:hypothetical protein
MAQIAGRVIRKPLQSIAWLKTTETDINACNVQDEEIIRPCADKVAREEPCPRASSIDLLLMPASMNTCAGYNPED